MTRAEIAEKHAAIRLVASPGTGRFELREEALSPLELEPKGVGRPYRAQQKRAIGREPPPKHSDMAVDSS